MLNHEPNRSLLKRKKENLVPLNVSITPNQRMMLDRESEATDKSVSLIIRDILKEHYKELTG